MDGKRFLVKFNKGKDRPYCDNLSQVLAFIVDTEKGFSEEMKVRQKAIDLLNSI